MADKRRTADEKTDESTDDRGTVISRRTCLRGLATTGLAGGFLQQGVFTDAAAACSTAADTDRFGDVIDVVEAGADNTGRESVSSLLQRLCDDDTLLVFPPGRYYMDEQVRFTGFDNFGLSGNGATLVPADFHSFDGPQNRLFRLGTHYSPGTDLLVEGFTVDYTAPDTGIRVLDVVVDDGLDVRNVDVYGRHDSGTIGPARFNVVDPDGSGTVDGFSAPDGGQWVSETPNAGNLWRGPTGILANMTKGTLRFTDCVLGGFPDNGLYASGDTGEIVVDGGHYKNSNGNSLRVGGHGSRIRGATVEIDETPYGFGAQRGIRLQDAEDVRIEDTSVTVTASNTGCTGVVVEGNCGDTWFEGLTVTIDSDVPNSGVLVGSGAGHSAIYKTDVEINSPGGFGIHLKGADGSAGANVERVAVTGDAGDEGARTAIYNSRDSARFGAVTVDQPGGEKRYGLVNTGDDCTVYKGEYRATNYAFTDSGTGTWVAEIFAESDNRSEAIALYDSSADVYLKNNTLKGGFRDYGSDGLKLVGNEF